jgi:hypothetical protein
MMRQSAERESGERDYENLGGRQRQEERDGQLNDMMNLVILVYLINQGVIERKEKKKQQQRERE